MFLDVLALTDELVFGGAGKTTLHRSAQLRSKARGGAGKLSGGKHRERSGFVFNVWVVSEVQIMRSGHIRIRARLEQAMDASISRLRSA